MIRFVAASMLLATLSAGAKADETYLRATCAMDFPEAMAHLQESIQRLGYTISRIQHVDKGLTDRGYESDKYKVVFFGKPDQMAEVAASYPVLIPFVPLSITISKEAADIIVSALAPRQLGGLGVSGDAEALITLWQQDIEQIVRLYAACQSDA